MNRTGRAADVAGGVPSDDDPNRRVRAVVRMLLAMREETKDSLIFPLGISRSAVYAKMRPSGPGFTVTELVRLARHFQVDPGVFLDGPRALLPASEREVITNRKFPRTPESGRPVPQRTAA